MKQYPAVHASLFLLFLSLVTPLTAQVLRFHDEKPQAVTWSPSVGESVPDIVLVDHNGKRLPLWSLRPHVVLVEVVDMRSPLMQALAGAGERGSLGDIEADQKTRSLEQYLPFFTRGLTLDDSDLVRLAIIRWNETGEPAKVEDAKRWARHFGYAGRPNHYVSFGSEQTIKNKKIELKPGMFLLSRNMVCRAAATGDQFTEEVITKELLPIIPELKEQRGNVGLAPEQLEKIEAEGNGRIVFTDTDLGRQKPATQNQQTYPPSKEVAPYPPLPEPSSEPKQSTKKGALPKDVSDASFKRDVLNERGVVIVDFYADWCGPCKRLAPTFQQLALQYGDAEFKKLDVDANPKTAAKYGVRSIPTLIFFVDGEEKFRLKGAQPKAVLEKRIQSLL